MATAFPKLDSLTKEQLLFMAKVSEAAERYEGMCLVSLRLTCQIWLLS